jgi:hypothetical protein
MRTQTIRCWLLVPFALLVTAGCRAETPRAVTPTPPVLSPLASPTNRVRGPEDAVHAVLASSAASDSTIFTIFPKTVGSQTCQIKGGGPPPGIVVPGTCRTKVEASGPNYVVRFVETWDASRFHHQSDPSSGELQHTWSFVVSGTGDVVAQPQAGNFPPQEVF